MSSLFVQGNKIKFENAVYEIDDFYSDRLFEKCNAIAEQYESKLWIVNEVFLNRVQTYKAIELFFSDFEIDCIVFDKPSRKILPLLLDYADCNGIKTKGEPFLYGIAQKIIGFISIILSANYLMFKMIRIPKACNVISYNSKISLIRTLAAKNKLAFLKNVDFRFENIDDKDSIYNCYCLNRKLWWVIKAWSKSYGEIRRYCDYIQNKIGKYSSVDAYEYYSKRIVHTILYSLVINDYFSYNQGKMFYTGNNLDRFALIEEEFAQKHNIEVVCIPHGLEYGFKFPHCFIGDRFFTTSYNASLHLNSLYKTNKFEYSNDIATNMFSVKCENLKSDQKIVFFTEPREVEVNLKIIDELLILLKSKGLQLSLKLHPKDKFSDYEVYSNDIEIIHNFNESVTSNICISRKSTTLLEGIHNNSVAAAILTNNKDRVIFNTFPSLQDKSISVFESVDELFKWIIANRK